MLRRFRFGKRAEQSFKPADSGRFVEVSGKVIRLLSDDNEGSRHQRFIITIAGRRTLLIAHNIDLVERVPLGLGDRVTVKGMYEWNDLGGLLHWTHHDPAGIEEGGYIRYRGKQYE